MLGGFLVLRTAKLVQRVKGVSWGKASPQVQSADSPSVPTLEVLRGLGRRLLNCVATIVTPDTIMRWQRRLIAGKWTYQQKRDGRRGVMREIKAPILRLAKENATWVYTRPGRILYGRHHLARVITALL